MTVLNNTESIDSVIKEMQEAVSSADSNVLDISPDKQFEVNDKVEDELVDPEVEFKNDQNYSSQGMTEEESEARSRGWRPKVEFKGDPEEFKSARQFLKDGELYEKISKQNKELKQMQMAVQEMMDITKRKASMELKEREEWFKQQKRQAIETGNVSDVERYDKALDEVRSESDKIKPNSQQQVSQSNIPPEAEEFVRSNASWFNDDSSENSKMKEFAIKKDAYLAQKYPNWTDAARLRETERSVKDFFPHRFGNPNRSRPNSITNNQPDAISMKDNSKKFSFNQLPSNYKSVVRTMAARSGISLDDYAQQLFDMGVVKRG